MRLGVKRRSLTFRVLLGAVIWVTFALGAGGVAVLEVFRSSALRQFDQRITEEIALLSVGVARTPGDPGQQMTSPSFARVYSGLYWQAQSAEATFRSRSLWDQSLDLSVAGFQEADGPDGQKLRLLARWVNAPDGTAWRIAIAADLAALDREMRQFQRGLIPAAALLAATLLCAAVLLLRSALGPLARLRRAVQALRQDSEVTIVEQFPAEVAPLVDDLNAVLDKNTRLREHGRAQAANLAHALKTPAAILQNEVDRARQGGEIDLDLTNEAITRITEAAARHMSAATGPDGLAPGQRFDASALLEETGRAIERLFPDILIERESPGSLLVRMAPADQQEVFGNLLENAGKWARSRMKVTLSPTNGSMVLRVEDDGPGVPGSQRGRVLQQGVRLDQQVNGSGLGLAIVDEIVTKYEGHLTLGESELGGLLVEVKVPLTEAA